MTPSNLSISLLLKLQLALFVVLVGAPPSPPPTYDLLLRLQFLDGKRGVHEVDMLLHVKLDATPHNVLGSVFFKTGPIYKRLEEMVVEMNKRLAAEGTGEIEIHPTGNSDMHHVEKDGTLGLQLQGKVGAPSGPDPEATPNVTERTIWDLIDEEGKRKGRSPHNPTVFTAEQLSSADPEHKIERVVVGVQMLIIVEKAKHAEHLAAMAGHHEAARRTSATKAAVSAVKAAPTHVDKGNRRRR